MKNEIKPDMAQEKVRLFAQYVGQKVFFTGPLQIKPHINNWGSKLIQKSDFLLLTPLSQITDEDAIEVARVYKSNVRGYSVIGASGVSKEEFLRAGKEFCKRLDGNFWNNFANMFNMLAAFDYLRSRGYALPFMGISVEEMVELGWIKLKGDSNHG